MQLSASMHFHLVSTHRMLSTSSSSARTRRGREKESVNEQLEAVGIVIYTIRVAVY